MTIRSASGRLRISSENVKRLEQESGHRFPTNIEDARALMNEPGYLDQTIGEGANPALRQMITAFFKLHGDGAVHDSSASTGADQRAAREGNAPSGPIVTDTVGQ